ncbi:PREDICTED: developmental pluripotency-associated 5 protein [Dipodomys ordii]|uniref:Developmental pluripotency-associated 5 protein n=1 Tax=Dipodomys ordii TaxID=10020 RepID=A0A1S3GJL5_DIPOR|nr:PREDICTED: developmental pluripotency-associated 5 protein [Dipodomys ordii]
MESTWESRPYQNSQEFKEYFNNGSLAFQVQTCLLDGVFGPQGSRIPHMEKVCQVKLELKTLESSGLTEVVIQGFCVHRNHTKWMLESMLERHRLRQKRGVSQLEAAMNSLELDG